MILVLSTFAAASTFLKPYLHLPLDHLALRFPTHLYLKYDLYLFLSCSNEVRHILFRIDIELFEKMVQVDIPLSSRFINAEKIASHHILSLTDDEGLNALRILHESKDIKL